MHLLCLLFVPLHAFYLSVIDIQIVDDRISTHTVKIFSDDLSDAVRAEVGIIVPLDGDLSKEHINAIEKYFSKHLYAEKNLTKYPFTIESISRESESTWINFISDLEVSDGHILIADYLMNLFPTQINMCKINRDGEQRFVQIKKKNKAIKL